MMVVPYIEIEGRTLARRRYQPDEMSGFASKLSEKFERAYVVDLEGIARNRPQLDVAREISEEIPTMYEGGVRFASNVIDMLITGAEKCVVGTATLQSMEELRGAFKLSENITFKVDFDRDGIVSFDPHISSRAFLDLAGDVAEIGVSDLVVPKELAQEISALKKKLGISVGVFAPVSFKEEMERLGADYIVSKDFGSLVGDERA